MALVTDFAGTGNGAWTGRSVSNAGDINGDGFDDVVIGAPRADQGGVDAGTIYVIYGGPDGLPEDIELGSLDGAEGFLITGAEAGGQAGISVSSAGDINNDGIDDILIGAREADPPGAANAGSVYLVFGRSGGFGAELDLSTLDGNTGFRIDGDIAGGRFGRSVAITADINDDGIDDMVIGAPDASLPGRAGAGAAYALFGRSAGFAPRFSVSDLDGSNGFRISGADAGDTAGISVSGAGDFNGDGIGDLIIGAEGADPGGRSDAGESYVLFGRASVPAADVDLRTLSASDGVILAGSDRWSYSGAAVAGGGDFNGDGFGDVIVGAPYENGTTGTAFVVFGSDSGLPGQINLDTLDGTTGFRLDNTAGGELGFSVAMAGDVNDDGFDDILAGAYRSSAGGTNLSGTACLVFGQSGGFAPTINDTALDGTNGYRIYGASAGDNLGFSSAGGGDTNGDGFSDLLLGALYAGTGDPGAAVSILGGTDNLARLSAASGGNGGINLGLLCFAGGTLIDTPGGPRPVDDLRAGDLVTTADHGAQPLIWAGGRQLETAELILRPRRRPIRIRAGALAPGAPARDLVVSPQHRILVTGRLAQRFGAPPELLVPAVRLVGLPGISRDDHCRPVRYLHLLCARHEILTANGAAAESLWLGGPALDLPGPDARDQIARLARCHRLDTTPARPLWRGRTRAPFRV